MPLSALHFQHKEAVLREACKRCLPGAKSCLLGEMAECFICRDVRLAEGLRRFCDCKNLLAHHSCLLTWVTKGLSREDRLRCRACNSEVCTRTLAAREPARLDRRFRDEETPNAVRRNRVKRFPALERRFRYRGDTPLHGAEAGQFVELRASGAGEGQSPADVWEQQRHRRECCSYSSLDGTALQISSAISASQSLPATRAQASYCPSGNPSAGQLLPIRQPERRPATAHQATRAQASYCPSGNPSAGQLLPIRQPERRPATAHQATRAQASYCPSGNPSAGQLLPIRQPERRPATAHQATRAQASYCPSGNPNAGQLLPIRQPERRPATAHQATRTQASYCPSGIPPSCCSFAHKLNSATQNESLDLEIHDITKKGRKDSFHVAYFESFNQPACCFNGPQKQSCHRLYSLHCLELSCGPGSVSLVRRFAPIDPMRGLLRVMPECASEGRDDAQELSVHNSV
ncbi:hypothetical protein P4O66_009812 [Electrophorus voltai]|uniref:RING-CH-type domain-containing protein n=1 Tax=Electrophorus voltai TaxID=2609070 RepID=A0AAD9DWR4_9TELE|nr:hypothetical protein P4O66_009812 [Electrophorus voltai]